ncbi:MAG: hypothetical protein IT515_13555 [Burkholderiales bacterium]|nr:hypothetical protein [Burkholderiales bacterium]
MRARREHVAIGITPHVPLAIVRAATAAVSTYFRQHGHAHLTVPVIVLGVAVSATLPPAVIAPLVMHSTGGAWS